jgi:hypothetical protein
MMDESSVRLGERNLELLLLSRDVRSSSTKLSASAFYFQEVAKKLAAFSRL